jgi:putative transposase
MPFVRVWIHAVWSTKDWEPLLERTIRHEVFEHIFENGCKKGLAMARVNGFIDHTHALFALPKETSISKALQLLKGESSHWINTNSIIKKRFEWQDEYFAKSVSQESLRNTCLYIDNQEEHHKVVSFKEEYNKLIQETAMEAEFGLKSINP